MPIFDPDDNAPVSKLSPLVKRVQGIAQRAAAQRQAAPAATGGAHAAHQLDLFVADLLDYNFKGDMASMEAPMFSLATKPDMTTWRWTSPDTTKWLEVTPSSIGRATMHDKDLLIYLTSQLMAAMNLAARSGGAMPGRRIQFTPHDYMLATRRDTSGNSYKNFEATLDRLSGTRLKTNIEQGQVQNRASFGLIERSNLVIRTDKGGHERLESVEVILSEWLYRALEQKNVLTINDRYFSLRKPLEKRLYEIGRKHVGKQAEWTIKEDNLLEKTGSVASKKEFRRMLSIIIEDDSIPDYRMIQLKNTDGENMVKFYQKNTGKLAEAYAKTAK
jgi:plasmid replication initiation protein